MGIAGVRSPDNVKFFDKKPLCVVYYDVDYTKNPKGTLLERGGREGGIKERERVPHKLKLQSGGRA